MDDDVEIRVVQVSDVFSSTPEGQHGMDELRRRYEQQERELDALLTPEARARLRQAEIEADRKFLGL